VMAGPHRASDNRQSTIDNRQSTMVQSQIFITS
jgi:hypothetical protein